MIQNNPSEKDADQKLDVVLDSDCSFKCSISELQAMQKILEESVNDSKSNETALMAKASDLSMNKVNPEGITLAEVPRVDGHLESTGVNKVDLNESSLPVLSQMSQHSDETKLNQIIQPTVVQFTSANSAQVIIEANDSIQLSESLVSNIETGAKMIFERKLESLKNSEPTENAVPVADRIEDPPSIDSKSLDSPNTYVEQAILKLDSPNFKK